MQAAIRNMRDGSVALKLDADAARAIFASVLFASRFHEGISPLVHHLANGTEITDHFVNEYRIRLIADKRSDVNPDGLWIAEYSERPIDGERRNQILNAPDAVTGNEAAANEGGQ